jgi:protoporphyrinogen oxidase
VRIAVAGAGVCGLVAARRLALAGHRVDVYERWPGLGGQAATLDVGDGHRLERYYHHLFTSDVHIARLYEELGMPSAIEWRPSSVAFFARGALHPFVTPQDLLRFKPLPPLDRVRMGAAALALQRFASDRAPYERITARDWIVRRMGGRAWDEVWGPLLRGKFGERADAIAMVWLWSKLRLRRSVRGEDVGQERLGYPGESWEPLFELLAGAVTANGGRVLIDAPVARLARAGAGFELQPGPAGSFRRGHDPRTFDAGPPEAYDRVLATVPSDIFEELLEPALAQEVGEGYLGRARSIEYFAALCLLLELDRRFSPYYWTNVADTSLPFVGLIEHTNFIEPERYGGRRFLYVANYLEHGHELLGLGADALLERYEPGLRAVNPGFRRDWVLRSWLHSEPAAQPIVTVGYGERIPPLRTPARGLVLANTTQVYPEDRGTNYAVRLGEQAARELLAD